MQFEDRPQVDVGLTGPGLHLDSEVAGVQGSSGGQTVAELDGSQVLEDLFVKEGEAVADAEVVFGEGERCSEVCRVTGDGELGPADLLAGKQVTDRFDRLELEVEVGVEVESHRREDTLTSGQNPRNGTGLPSCWMCHRRAPPQL